MDRRTRKTQAAIIDALDRLLGMRDLDEIGVQDICDEADIARSSFYKHFDNKREVLTASLSVLRDGLNDGRDLSYAGRFTFLPGLLWHIETRNGGGRASSRPLLGPVMLDEFKGFVRGLVEGALKPDRVRLGPTRLAYVSGGVLAAMEAWLGSGCRKDVAVLVSEIEDATSAILGE